MRDFLRCLLCLLVASSLTSSVESDELGNATVLFSGPLELVAENKEFYWLESPIWSETGKYLLFSDVKWQDENNHTCGMIWRYDDVQGVTKFLPCSGLVGPGETPDNIADYIEAGSNGLYWGWGGDGKDLLICQHGKHRIVRINVSDVDENGDIDPNLVSVVADSYNGTMLNSPNDIVMVGDTLYFTDPPFGHQYFSSDDAVAVAFESMTQDGVGVYSITGDPGTTAVEPVRILDFGNPNPWEAPNGVAINKNGDVLLALTNFHGDPRFEVHSNNGGGVISDTLTMRLESEFRIQGENSGFPALNDGITYSAELDVIFGSGPGGVYMYNGTTYELLGFLRLDDLSSNNVIGGGYLWMTVNTRIMRIPLASTESPTPAPTSSAMKSLVRASPVALYCAAVFVANMF